MADDNEDQTDDTGQSDLAAARQARYDAARSAALGVQAIRDRDAAQYQPPGSPSQYLSSEGKLLGPVQYDELGIPKPAPLGNVGIRGYPTADEYAAADARFSAQAKEDQFNADLNAVGSRYPAAPKFDMPSTDQLISPLIAARRNAVQSQLNDEQSRAAGLSTAPVFSGGRYGRRWGPSPASVAQRNIAGLQSELGRLDRAQQETISDNTRLALAKAKQNDVVSQNTARGQVVDFLSNIDPGRYPIGSPDRERLIGRVFGSRPDWLGVMAKDKNLAKYVQDHVEAHQSVAQTMAALQAQYPDESSLPTVGGVRMVPTINAKGQTSFRAVTSLTPEQKEEVGLTKKLHQLTGLTPDEYAALGPDAFQAGGVIAKNAQGKDIFHLQGGGFNLNGTPKGDFSNDYSKFVPTGTQITDQQKKDFAAQLASGGAIQVDTGKGYKSTIPRNLHEQFQQAFGTGGPQINVPDQSQLPPVSGKTMSFEDYKKLHGL